MGHQQGLHDARSEGKEARQLRPDPPAPSLLGDKRDLQPVLCTGLEVTMQTNFLIKKNRGMLKIFKFSLSGMGGSFHTFLTSGTFLLDMHRVGGST